MKQFYHLLAFSCLFVLLGSGARAVERPGSDAPDRSKGMRTTEPFAFIENRGQIYDTDGRQRTDIAFVAASGAMRVFVSPNRISYVFAQHQPASDDAATQQRRKDMGSLSTIRVDMDLVGARPDVTIRGEDAHDGAINVYAPAAPDGILGLRMYNRIVFENVYENIDLVYRTEDGTLKYDFVVRPGGRVSDIRLRYTGAEAVRADADGGLRVVTPIGEMLEGAPVSYQTCSDPLAADARMNVRSSFILDNNEVRFSVAPSDPAATLVIDPTLQWSTYYGGANFEFGHAVTSDAVGNVIAVGYTFSTNFPVSAGTLQSTNAGSQDAFIVKFDPAGTRLWATYYGGIVNDPAHGVAVDGTGNIYVGGFTESVNFPVTPGAYQTVKGNVGDGWLLKLTPTGTRLWATYVGANNDDVIYALTCDPAGDVYVTGTTSSTNFPVSGSVVQPTFGGYTDAFVMRFTPAGVPTWSTYFGGANEESGEGIALDPAGNVVFTGTTLSYNLPLSPSPSQGALAGSNDAYVAKLTSSGGAMWSTYFGGSSYDAARAVAVDNAGAVTITGLTHSNDLPTTINALRPFPAGNEDAFVAHYSATGARIWSTYLGGALNDEAFAAGADALGRITIGGQTYSPNFPLTAGALQNTRQGLSDAFVVKFDSSGRQIWGSLFGGGSDDAVYGLSSQYSGNILLTGWTFSNDFPTTTGAFQTTKAGSYDAIIVKICDVKPLVTTSRSANMCPGDSVTLDAGPGYASYLWSTSETTQSIKVGTGGPYWVTVTDGIGCTGTSDTLHVNISPVMTVDAGPDVDICHGSSTLIGLPTTGGTLPLRYTWTPAAGLSDSTIAQPDAFPTITTMYYVSVTDAHGCTSTDSVLVFVNENPLVDAGANDTICHGASIVLGNAASLGTPPYAYQWTPAYALDDDTLAQPTATPLVTTRYFVTVTDAKGCTFTDSVLVTVNQLVASAGPDRSLCQGDSISIGEPALGGFGSLTYTWSPSTGLSNNAVAQPKAAPGATQQYIVTVQDALGCVSTDTVVVHVYNALKALAGDDVEICLGGWTLIGDTAVCGTAPYTYAWTPSTGLSDTSIVHPIANPSVTTTYTLTVTDANSLSVTDVVTVTVNNPPIADAGQDTTFICGNTSTTIGQPASGGTGPYTYAWSPVTGLDDPTGMQTLAAPLATTRYYVTVTDAKGCTAVDSVLIQVSDLTAHAGTDTYICAGDSLMIGAPATGGSGPYTYEWFPTTGLGTPAAAVTFAKPASTTTYVVKVTDSLGCVARDTVTIVVEPLPIAFAGNDTTVCRIERLYLGGPATGGTGPYTYAWSPATDLSSTTIMRPIATPRQTRTWVLTVTDAKGCKGYDTVTVFVRPWPLAQAGNDTLICRADSISLGAPASGGQPPYLYNWSPSYGLNDSTVAQPKASPFQSTTYIMTVTDALGCISKDTVRINVTTPALAKITVLGPTTLCPGDSVWLDADPTLMYSGYLWNTGDTTRRIKVGATGDYQAEVNTLTPCPGITPQVRIWVATAPEPLVSQSGPLAFCAGGSVTLSVDSIRFASIRWSTGARTASITVSASGTYYVDVTNFVGCPARSLPYTVTVRPLPTPTISAAGPVSICEGENVVLTVDDAYASYLWSNGATTRSITVTQGGSYSVTVTDGFGCSNTSAPIVVTVNPNPTPVIAVSGSLSFCEGGSVRLDAGAGFAAYLWSNGATTRNITVTEAGSYTCTVTTTAGCSGTTPPRTVVVHPRPTPTIIALGNEVFCEGDSVTLDAGGGYQSYLWSNGRRTRTITVKTAGVYTVTVTDTLGCSAAAAGRTVIVNPRPVVAITAVGATTFCAGDSVVLDAGDHISYVWSNGQRTRRITVRESGSFTVRVENIEGCSQTSAPIAVTRVAPPEPVITAGGPLAFCQGGSVVLDAGAGYATYEWSTGARTRRLTVTQAGTYNVRVTNSTGCRGESQFVNVTVHPLPSPPIIAQVGQTSLASTPATTYQWRLAGTPIAGATSRVYIPTRSGVYSVTITDENGCSATSAPFPFTLVGVEDASVVASFDLYPDPNVGQAVLHMTLVSPMHVRLSLMNLLGQELLAHDEGVVQTVRRELDMRALTPGMYFLHITAGNRTMIRKLVRQ